MPRIQKCQALDSAFLLTVLSNDCLAASPYAANLNDPLLFGVAENTPAVRFLFSDIPDKDFREPHAVIMKSAPSEGREN